MSARDDIAHLRRIGAERDTNATSAGETAAAEQVDRRCRRLRRLAAPGRSIPRSASRVDDSAPDEPAAGHDDVHDHRG